MCGFPNAFDCKTTGLVSIAISNTTPAQRDSTALISGDALINRLGGIWETLAPSVTHVTSRLQRTLLNSHNGYFVISVQATWTY